jgi:hypothetical protein
MMASHACVACVRACAPAAAGGQPIVPCFIHKMPEAGTGTVRTYAYGYGTGVPYGRMRRTVHYCTTDTVLHMHALRVRRHSTPTTAPYVPYRTYYTVLYLLYCTALYCTALYCTYCTVPTVLVQGKQSNSKIPAAFLCAQWRGRIPQLAPPASPVRCAPFPSPSSIDASPPTSGAVSDSPGAPSPPAAALAARAAASLLSGVPA